jgi:hypothetical protein
MDIWYQDLVGTPGHPGREHEPPGSAPNRFQHHDPVVGLRGGVEPVDCLGNDRNCSVKADRDLGPGDIVIDGLGNPYNADSPHGYLICHY